MSIGKSAIKRVENNGYSKVQTSAPDMQNSHVIAAPAEEVMEKIVAPIEKKTAAVKKTPASTTTSKTTSKTAVKKPAVAKKSPQKTPVKQKNGFVTCLLGEELPYYLL